MVSDIAGRTDQKAGVLGAVKPSLRHLLEYSNFEQLLTSFHSLIRCHIRLDLQQSAASTRKESRGPRLRQRNQ